MRLVASKVAVFRGDRLVLWDIGFAVPAGGALLLTGPNGAGKSTLLRMLAGLVRRAAGNVTFDGRPDFGAAFLGHLDAVKPGLSVAENLAFAAAMGRGDSCAALEGVGLGGLAGLPARLLSAGQRRRLALARLSLSPVPLWLLDEPTLGVDAENVARFGAVLGRHRAAGGVVVAATHLPLPLPGAAVLAL